MQTWDPKSVVITFAGITITGFAAGTFIVAEEATDRFTKVVGADGEVARSQSRDESGTVTITLLGSSEVNKLLSDQLKADAKSGSGTGSFMMKDTKGTTIISSDRAWIRRRPNFEGAVEVTNREWIFDLATMSYDLGGSNA